MVRDEEIQRLISYAKGLGLKVQFSSKDIGGTAEWYLDNSGIVISKKDNKTKIDTVLSLIHELGHALHNIYEKNRKIDTNFENALDHLDEAELLEIDTEKKQRKILLTNEIAGTRYWDAIYKETNMGFPTWRLELQKEFDIFQYQYYYENDQYPTKRQRSAKFKELRRKYRG